MLHKETLAEIAFRKKTSGIDQMHMDSEILLSVKNY